MGAIQSSINSMLGSVAGAAVGIKHIAQQSEANALTAENQALTAQGEAERATESSIKEINDWKTETDAEGKTMGLKHAEAKVALDEAEKKLSEAKTPIEKLEGRSARDMAKKAFDALNDEYNAIIERANRAATLRAHAEMMTTRAEEAKAKHESFWGGRK